MTAEEEKGKLKPSKPKDFEGTQKPKVSDAKETEGVLGKETILTITEKGYGKRSEIDAYRLTGRACKGVINLKVSEKTGNIVTTVSVSDKDSIIATTAKGMVIRTEVKQLRVMGRATQGVRIVKLHDGDKVTDLVKVQDTENGENGAN